VNRCAGTKRDGSGCRATVNPPQTLCWLHNPENAEKRKRTASKAGKTRPNRKLAELHQRLDDLYEGVLEKRISTSVGAVATQITNASIRLVEVELKVKEHYELATEVAEIREWLEIKEGGKRSSWG
jgi:hypothetical protein